MRNNFSKLLDLKRQTLFETKTYQASDLGNATRFRPRFNGVRCFRKDLDCPLVVRFRSRVNEESRLNGQKEFTS